MWASTLWPFSSSTRNMALGSGSTTVPSRTIASSLGFGRVDLRDVRGRAQAARQARATGLGPNGYLSKLAPQGQLAVLSGATRFARRRMRLVAGASLAACTQDGRTCVRRQN